MQIQAFGNISANSIVFNTGCVSGRKDIADVYTDAKNLLAVA